MSAANAPGAAREGRHGSSSVMSSAPPASGRRSGRALVHGLDDDQRHSHVPPAPSAADRLYARLSRIALDLDDLALELAAVGLSFEQAEGMRVPAAHLALAVDRIEGALYRAQTLDQSHRARDLAFHRELLAVCHHARGTG